MDLAALRSRVARRWWVVAILAALTVAGATVATGDSGEHQTTVKFVMRPDASVSTHDQPAALDALKSDSPLVQTVIGVLGSRSMLRQGATEAGLTLTPAYSVDAVAEPGSTLIDSTVTGPNRAVVDRLAAGYGRAATSYVSASYSAYVLERLSTAPGGDGTGPSDVQVVILALLVGSALGVALVAGELLVEPRLRRFFARSPAAESGGTTETEPAENGGQSRPDPEVRFGLAPRPGPTSVPTVRPAPQAPRGLTTPTKPTSPRGVGRSPAAPRRVARPPSARQETNGSRSPTPRPRSPPLRQRAPRSKGREGTSEAGASRGRRLTCRRRASSTLRRACPGPEWRYGRAGSRWRPRRSRWARPWVTRQIRCASSSRGLGGLAVTATLVQLRWCLVAVLLLLVAYIPDVLATRSSAHALIAIILAGTLARWAAGRERLTLPPELIAFGALALAYICASVFASDRGAAAAETLDLLSYGAVVAMLLLLLDTTVWLRRAVWAVVAGVGLLALVAIVQQVTKTYGSSYGGFASILPAGDAMRSAGPLNPNPFGQILATSAVLAFYLARTESRVPGRALAAAISVACVLGVTYTESRAALIALLIVAVGIGALARRRDCECSPSRCAA